MWLYAIIIVLIIIVFWLASRDAELRYYTTIVREVANHAANAANAATPDPSQVTTVADVSTPSIGGATIVAEANASTSKEKFCPKLGHRHGLCDAGARPESMNPSRGTFYDAAPLSVLPGTPNYFQGFSPDRNHAGATMWSGYMNSSVLPL